MDFAAFQASLEDKLPGNFVLNDDEAIVKCVEELTIAIQAVSAPKHRPLMGQRPLLLASIQDEIGLKNQLRRQ